MDRLTKTAPERIFLQCGDEEENKHVDFAEMHDVSWCADSVTWVEIEYVRKDVCVIPDTHRVVSVEFLEQIADGLIDGAHYVCSADVRAIIDNKANP